MSLYDNFKDEYDVWSINDARLELLGGGDYYNDDGAEPDDETWGRAEEIAAHCGRRIIGARGTWEGWSEYTPDPGNISIFYWEPL